MASGPPILRDFKYVEQRLRADTGYTVIVDLPLHPLQAQFPRMISALFANTIIFSATILVHSILAVAQTKKAFASNLKRWMDLR